MNLQNAVALLNYLDTLDPDEFDYTEYLLSEPCGCAAFHVAKHQGAIRGEAHPIVLEQFLGITEKQAKRMYWAELLADGRSLANFKDGSWHRRNHTNRVRGIEGINRAIAILHEIAAEYGHNLFAARAANPQLELNADAFIRQCREAVSA